MEDKTRKGYATMEQQMEADKRWREKNRERSNYIGARGSARSFIRRKATLEDLDELENLIADRREALKAEKES